MKDWLDCPVPGYRQRIKADYWCRHCKEQYSVTLRMENDTGEYGGDTQCPLCGKDGCDLVDGISE